MAERWIEHQRHVLSELDRVSLISVDMNESLVDIRERLARLEQQNEAYALERKKISEDLLKVQLRLAWYAGGLAVLIFIVGVGWKLADVIWR